MGQSRAAASGGHPQVPAGTATPDPVASSKRTGNCCNTPSNEIAPSLLSATMAALRAAALTGSLRSTDHQPSCRSTRPRPWGWPETVPWNRS